MSTYYLVNNETNAIFPLGETSFNKFYPEDSWFFLNGFIEREDMDSLLKYTIKKDDGSSMDIIEFLDEITKYKIMD